MGVIKINCDICGKKVQLFKTDIESTIMNVCQDCSKFGKVISVIKQETKEAKKEIKKQTEEQKPEEELVLAIVPSYGEIIKKKREELGIKQEDFAKKINEKVSLLHKIETSQFEPSISLARKIEKFLHVKIVEIEEAKPGSSTASKSESFTIGDFIKVRK